MIRLKNETQIEGIRTSCKALSAMLRELLPLVKPGVNVLDLDHWAREWIRKIGGKPAFLGYGPRENPFPGALCVSINEQVIHGVPRRRVIKEGDLVGVDSGINLGGFISDQALTVEAGRVSAAAHKLNVVTRDCLYAAIAAVKPGDRLLQIARAVEGIARPRGYGIVEHYGGHGVGFAIHEDPIVSNVARGANPRMQAGMVLAIEPMINMGTSEVELLEDGWTVVTADGKLSAHWEHTVAIFHDHAELLTERVP
ncbi:MAG: type I methionyl aminopeptidase [Treponema sp.]|jgi:methionyl aminopeptidase|nr:type I methionyl aminopeptidase [Treponema sp.]